MPAKKSSTPAVSSTKTTKKASAAAAAPEVAKKKAAPPVTAKTTKTTKSKAAATEELDVTAEAVAAPKKKPGRPAKAAGAGDKPAAKRGRKPKAAAKKEDADFDDADLSDIEEDLTEEVVEEVVADPAAPVEKVKPLRMKISKAKERALMKEFGLDDTVLSEEEARMRRERLKTLIKLGKTRGYLTHGEINDHLPDKLVEAETLEVVVSLLNDMGVAVYEQTPDAETLLLSNSGPTAATEEEAEEEAEAALSTVDSEF
ncbi:MAG: RNA polymerase sigma factor region1.1 domain-containing protein, partial [Gammaproteobacteria bacterium]